MVVPLVHADSALHPPRNEGAHRDCSLPLVVIVQVLALLSTIGITFLLRKRVREANGIEGNAVDDVLMACCCGPCSLAQMDRQTSALVPGAHASWQEELGLPLPKPEELGQVQEQLPTPQDGYIAAAAPPMFQPQVASFAPTAQAGEARGYGYFQDINEATSGLSFVPDRAQEK